MNFNLSPLFISQLEGESVPFLQARLLSLNEELNRFSLSRIFPVKKDRSVLRTGLIVDEKDVAGKLLSTRITEKSALESFLNGGYIVELLEFDLDSIKDMSELEILREFNSQYGSKYDIILYSEAVIDGFTQKGDLYQITAESVLYEVDLWDHRVRNLGKANSSVSGNDPGRLITSVFFQLGNNIARMCFDLNKN